ncbi:putative acyl-CoA synthetase YngI [Mercenaria mercenaria]|uniref:putative acyl-CoA synthetase YngI n=1 Tax=Mercenaria mercenaria TaxID=6596 RepID=UPI00234ED6B7|nr:putative acyl-CoA synthetase YngI [Mercenaria mercenaria]
MDTSGKSYFKVEGTPHGDGPHNIPDCIKRLAESHGENEAFVFADHGGGRQGVTFAEIYKKCVEVARSLIQLGVKKGELVAINVRSCPEWLYFAFGIMFAGAVPVSISFTYKDGSDLIALMEKLKTCCLLALDPGEDGWNWEIVKNLLDSYHPDGTASSRKLPSLRYIIGHEVVNTKQMHGVKTIQELIDGGKSTVTFPALDADDLAFLVQTSGSTGVPKLVAHTHRSIMSVLQLTSFGILDSSVVQYNDRPFTWIGGFPLSIMSGQKRVTVSGFSPKPKNRVACVIDIVQREKCTLLTALPPMLHELICTQNIPEDWPVKVVLTGGQPLTKGVARAIGKVAPSISPAYGGTEFLIASSAEINDQSAFQEFFSGKIAKIAGLEVKIVDENGDTVPVNTRGEVYIRSPGMFKEYYNDPDKTAAVLTDDGWYITDDIGMMTSDADLFVYGRKSNMIISGGMNVTPEILEHAIKTCPGVATVVVVPVPDEVYYQVLCACVIRRNGSNVTEEQLRRYCDEIHNDSPGMFTVLPKYYMFFEAFPETITGKTNRVELIKMATEAFRAT